MVMTLVAFKNSRIFSVSSLRSKILDISATSWVLKSLILQMDFKYASELLSRAGLTDSKTVDTPVELNAHLTPSGGKPLSNPSLYRRWVNSLVYLTVTLPNISYVVHQVSQYLSTPQSTHYATILLILQYLKGTLFHSLFYSTQSPLVLYAFSNANWVKDPTDRKSTTGYCFLLDSSLISWRSKKQTFMVRSTTMVS